MILEFCKTLESPPEFSPPRDFVSYVGGNKLETWFWRLPFPIGVYVTGCMLCRPRETPAAGIAAVQLAVGKLAGVVSASELEQVRDQAHWQGESTNNPLVVVAAEFAEAVLERRDVRWFYDRFYWRLLVDGERVLQSGQRDIRPNLVMPIVAQVINKIREVFQPPVEFTPTSKAEWLIAADLLEEAGEIRAEPIRLAAVEASDKEIFQALYRVLPPELLVGDAK